MNDDTLNAILRRIITEPDVDLHRLVYADRLDELGEQLYADSIRYGMCVDQLNKGSTSLTINPTYYTKVYNELVEVGVDSYTDRGFVCSIKCTAATFLKHADALIWHETQTVPLPKCEACGGTAADERGRWKDKHGHDYWIRCATCKGIAAKPRPCPPTAQPIRRVVLTTYNDTFLIDCDFSVLNTTGVVGEGKWSSPKWPGVEFVLPSVHDDRQPNYGGTEAVSDDDEPYVPGDEELPYIPMVPFPNPYKS